MSRRVLYRYFCLWSIAFCVLAPGRREIRGQPGGAVYYVSLAGDDRNPGTAERPWRHVEWAMTRPLLQGGDTIRIRQGVYRPIAEAVPNRDSPTDDTLIRPVAGGERDRPITVTAEPGAAVTLSGRFLAERWQPFGTAGVYYYDYSTPVSFPFDHPFQVVEDGRLLSRVATLDQVDRPGRCFVDTGIERIYVWPSGGGPPAAHKMEYGGSAAGIDFLGGARYWRLAGFRLEGFKTAGVLVRSGAGSIELDHMDISYVGAARPGADPSSGYALVVYDTAGGNYVHDCNLHHTLAEAVHISQTGAGGDLYQNNEIHEAGGAEWLAPLPLVGPGLILRGSGITVRGNRFWGNGYHGLILESDLRGSEGPAAPSQNIIEGNVFASNRGNGLYGDGKNGVTPSRANIIRFNLFDSNNQGRAGSSGDGEMRLAGNFDDTLLYNNTFYGDKANGVLIYAGRLAAGTAQGADAVPDGTRLVNNTTVHLSRSAALYPLRVIDAGDLTADCNNWFRPAGGPLVSWNGLDLAQIEDFRRQTAQERRGLAVDPRFVWAENGCFWLRAVSPLIGRGAADIRGDGTVWAAPPGGAAPDLGAFPYRPLLAISTTELRFAALARGREPARQTIEIESAARTPLGWTARTSGEKWLQLSATAGDAPAGLGVAARTGGLAAGSYAGTVLVAPAIEGEPAVAVRVTLAIVPAPPRKRASP